MGKKEKEPALYWSRPDNASAAGAPIAVVFAWMFSKRRHVAQYLRLFNSCGWAALACHPPVLNLWLPSRAESLARLCLDELAEEVKEERRPIVVVSFSGGVKACQYKFLTLLLREASQEKNMKHALDATPSYKVLRQCIAGQIFDSCPIDFVSQIGARFLSQPPGTGKSQRSSARAAAASAAAVVMDAIFLREFEKQRADVWEVLRRSAIFGPVLLFFSKNDELAPHERVSQFAAEMAKNGSKVTAICWDVSEHVGHLRHHPDEYSRNVVKFLEYVLDTWSRRIQAGGEHEVVVGPSGDENLQIGVNSIIGHYEIPDLRTAARTDSSPEPRPFIRSKL